MPQMAPLLWLNLYVFFSAVFILTIILIFFMKPPIKIEAPSIKTEKLTQNWKW
uniref:ATP synthase F0 subunit 8 n=1 Tax=Palaemon macrodactylus TaxID=390956 RepID=UPI002435BAD8|nr:ATP synthase F0 subunit 8 [Palaemon macrodactylus]WEW73442.1 ATP synthase F0 subunit 8 [Palaemon macrodactylus]